MKKLLLTLILSATAPFVWAQSLSTATATPKVEGGGTITEYTPGSRIVLQESKVTRTYSLAKTVIYTLKSGKVVDEATANNRVKVGAKVHVHYVGEGDAMTVDRIILND